jgi:hypothetical protein
MDASCAPATLTTTPDPTIEAAAASAFRLVKALPRIHFLLLRGCVRTVSSAGKTPLGLR